MIDDDAFARFLADHERPLAAIAYWSRGVSTPEDVVQDAWVLAFELGAARGKPLPFATQDEASAFLKSLAARIRRLTDHPLAHATAMERRPGEHAGAWTPADWLADDDGDHPLSLLEALEAPLPAPPADPYRSKLDAWVTLHRRFERSYVRVATFLMISRSWCYVCRQRARLEAAAQVPLPDLTGGGDDASLQPWRRFRRPANPIVSTELQGRLDFWRRPGQPPTGQLWLP